MPLLPPYLVEEEIEENIQDGTGSDLEVEVGSRLTTPAPDEIEEEIAADWAPVFFNNGVEIPAAEIEEVLEGEPPSP